MVHNPILCEPHFSNSTVSSREVGFCQDLAPMTQILNLGPTVSNHGLRNQGFPVALVVKNLPADAGDIRDAGLIPGSGRSPGGGHGNPLQDSCLGNPLDRGPWRASVQRVTRSRTRLSTQVPGIRGAALPPLHTKVVLITTCYTLPLFSS